MLSARLLCGITPKLGKLVKKYEFSEFMSVGVDEFMSLRFMV